MRAPLPFGKYLLLERISVGGMAEVFKAKSFGVEGFEKIIAIKRILPSMAEDAEFVEMFIDEAKIAGQLSHANICQIFELGKLDGTHFIAMEYIWGKDLLQISNRLRKLGQKALTSMACFVAAKVCEALDYAHRRKDPQGKPLQIIHRDVSPQNVLVSYEGEVKIIDFGIAKAASAVRSSKTQAGVLKGKFGYMSPEQVRGLPLDRRSDVFAIGTLLHEVLTGEKLFANDNDFTTLERVRNAAVDPPSKLNPDVPAGLDRIVMKALARDVEARYQWANEMQEELQQLMVKSGAMFSSKQLALWMKDAFAADLARERQQLEKFKRMGRESLPPPPLSGSLDIVPGDATEVQDPVFAKPSQPAQRKPQTAGGSGGFGDEAPTSIFGGDNPEPAAPQRALAAMLQSIDTAIPSHLGAPPTQSLRGPGANSPLSPLPQPVYQAPTAPMPQKAADTLPVPLPPPPALGTMPVVPRVVDRQSRPMPIVSPPQQERPSRPMGAVPPPVTPPPRLPRPPGTPTPSERPSRPMAAQLQPNDRPSRPMAAQLQPSERPSRPMAAQLQPSERPSRPFAAVSFRPPPELDSLDVPVGYGGPGNGHGNGAGMPVGSSAMGVRSITGAFPATTTTVPEVRQRALGPSRSRVVAWVLGSAIIVGGLLLAAYFFGSRLLHHAPPPKPVVTAVATATLVVSTGDDDGAEVLVNGQSHGSIPHGEKTFQIDGLTPGDAEVTLRRKNVPDCTTKVNLSTTTPNVVTCGFTAKLLLVVTNDGATVFVDKQEISAVAAREQMTLPAGPHEITVEKDGFEPETIQLTLDPNEVREKRIELTPAEGKGTPTGPSHPGAPATPKPHASSVSPSPSSPPSAPSPQPATPRTPAMIAPEPKSTPPAEPRVTAPPEPQKPAPTPAEPKVTGGSEDSQSGFLSASSTPPARLIVDGNDTGKTTPSKIPVSPGKHKVTFVVGDQKFNYNIMVEPGQDYSLSKSLSVETGPDP